MFANDGTRENWKGNAAKNRKQKLNWMNYKSFRRAPSTKWFFIVLSFSFSVFYFQIPNDGEKKSVIRISTHSWHFRTAGSDALSYIFFFGVRLFQNVTKIFSIRMEIFGGESSEPHLPFAFITERKAYSNLRSTTTATAINTSIAYTWHLRYAEVLSGAKLSTSQY